jgi:hypothetical protein
VIRALLKYEWLASERFIKNSNLPTWFEAKAAATAQASGSSLLNRKLKMLGADYIKNPHFYRLDLLNWPLKKHTSNDGQVLR